MKYLLLLLSLFARDKGFSTKKITSQYPHEKRWEIVGDDKQALKILNQPFTYLSSGNHTYVFASEDGRHIIKFFKQKHMRTQSLLPMAKSTSNRRKKERKNSYTSYKIAYEALPELTATTYLHLTKTEHLNQKITLIDQHGKRHQLAADEMEFLLQRRAEVGFAHIEQLLKKGEEEQALDALCAYLKLIKTRAQKGIGDTDRQLFKNYGFIDGKPVEIDIGDFVCDPQAAIPINIIQELAEVSVQLLDFISTHAPELVDQLQKRIEQIIQTT